MSPRFALASPRYRRLGFAEAFVPGEDAFHLLSVTDRGAQVDVPATWSSAWWVLRGSVRAHAAHFDGEVPAGTLLTWQDGPLRLLSYAPAGVVGVCAPTPLWTRCLLGVRPGPGRLLLPWQAPATRAQARLLVRSARLARHGAGRQESALGALLAAIHDGQAPLREPLPLCSGRTSGRREQVLARLMRVRHLVLHGEAARLDLARLAAIASYSPAHLIRLYRDVFGETPAETSARRRVERSLALVRDTRMPIGDISEVVGFESKSAFCRSFKATFGRTTSEVRRAAR